jgi:hypothetical protein
VIRLAARTACPARPARRAVPIPCTVPIPCVVLVRSVVLVQRAVQPRCTGLAQHKVRLTLLRRVATSYKKFLPEQDSVRGVSSKNGSSRAV